MTVIRKLMQNSSALFILLVLSGCSMFKPLVVIPIEQPSVYHWPDINKIAILDFSGQYDYKVAGTIFSNKVRSIFNNNGEYDIIDVARVRKFIMQNRLTPSRFQELSTIRYFADNINVDAICFGDILTLSMKKDIGNKIKRKKMGRKLVEKIVVTSAGNTKVVTEYRTVYKDIKITQLKRVVKLAVKARLINSTSGRLLWEDEVRLQKQFYGIEDEQLGRQGHWETDEQLFQTNLDTAAYRLFRPLLRTASKRERQLAVSSLNDEYGLLIKQGNHYARTGEWNLAGQVWLQAYNLDPKRAPAVANLGVIREKNTEYDQAIKDYNYAGSLLDEPWASYGQDIISYRRKK